jgi:hypothetical protein
MLGSDWTARKELETSSPQTGGRSENDERTRRLEVQLRQYADENRLLEERLRSIEGATRTAPAGPIKGAGADHTDAMYLVRS